MGGGGSVVRGKGLCCSACTVLGLRGGMGLGPRGSEVTACLEDLRAR